MVIDVADEAEQRHDRNIRVALVEDFVRIVRDQHTGLDAETCKIADILSDNGGVDVDRADDLRAVLMQIAQNVLAHLAAAILYNLDLFHKKFLPSHKDNFVCGTPACLYS